MRIFIILIVFKVMELNVICKGVSIDKKKREEMQRLSSGILQHLEMRRNWRLRMSNQESRRKIRRDYERE